MSTDLYPETIGWCDWCDTPLMEGEKLSHIGYTDCSIPTLRWCECERYIAEQGEPYCERCLLVYYPEHET